MAVTQDINIKYINYYIYKGYKLARHYTTERNDIFLLGYVYCIPAGRDNGPGDR